MAAISRNSKIWTSLVNISYMCDPSYIPFSGARNMIMMLKYSLKVIQGHIRSNNIISRLYEGQVIK